VQRVALRGFDAVVPVSRGLDDRLRRAGVHGERITLIPNAIRPARLLPRPEARRRLGAPETGCLIGWVGRLSREKGPDLFIDALETLPDDGWQAVVAGDGPMRAALQSRTSADPRVRWAGAVPEAGALLRAFDLLVISSRTEGSPMILLEAMAAGTPVVATTVGGIPEMVSGQEALLVPPADGGALSGAIRRALADPAGTGRRAAAATARVADAFGQAPWLIRYERLYEQVISGSR
jgi:glycosyltransferase involved in cell wall biosynthesis